MAIGSESNVSSWNIRNPQFQCRIRIPIFFSTVIFEFKGNLMRVKCLVICTDLLLPLKVNFSYFKMQILMLLKLESESAMQKIRNRIRKPPIFWPDCHPWKKIIKNWDNISQNLIGIALLVVKLILNWNK